MRGLSAPLASFGNTAHGRAYRLRRAFDARKHRNILSAEGVLSDTPVCVVGPRIIGISPFESSRGLYKSRTSRRYISRRHSDASPRFAQRWKYGNIFTIEGHLNDGPSQLAIRYAIFAGNFSVGAIVLAGAPFKVADKIIRFVLILMVYERVVVGVRDKRLRDEAMNHDGSLFALLAQCYAIISVSIFVGVHNHSVVEPIRARIHAPKIANHIAAFVACYISPFFFHLLILYYADKLKKKRKGYQLTLVGRIANSTYPFSNANILKTND